MQYKVLFFIYFFSAIGYSDALRFEKSTESPTPEALPEASVSFYSAGAKDSAEEQPAYGTDTHGTAARKTARKERRGRSPERIATKGSQRSSGRLRGKKERDNYKGKGWKRSSRDSGPGIPQRAMKSRR